jgi:hypothetical protein
MPDSKKVLVVANRTACGPGLIAAVRERAARGDASFHLVVPAAAHGLHKVVDPEDSGKDESQRALDDALPLLSEAAGQPVTGEIGDAEPLAAIQDAIHLKGADEIIVSTLPRRVSKWLKLDLVSKARGLGLPVTHVEASEEPAEAASTVRASAPS